MSTINGIGIAYRGVSNPDADGIRTGTRWVTVLYLPIIPLARHRFKYGGSKASGLPYRGTTTSYIIFSNEPLDLSEIIMTYLLNWLVFPIFLIVIPAILLSIRPMPNPTLILILFLGWIAFTLIIVIPELSRRLIPSSPKKMPLPDTPNMEKQEKPRVS